MAWPSPPLDRDTLNEYWTFTTEGSVAIGYLEPYQLFDELEGPFILTVEYESPDGPLSYHSFSTEVRRENGTITRGNGLVEVRLCDFERIVIIATTQENATYAATETRWGFVIGGNQNGVDPFAERPKWCKSHP